MIDIVMNGICEGCEYANLEFDCTEFGDGRKVWSVCCTHWDSCRHMLFKAIAKLNSKDNNKIKEIAEEESKNGSH